MSPSIPVEWWPRGRGPGTWTGAPDHVGVKPGSQRACFVAWFLIFLSCDGDGHISRCIDSPEDEPVYVAKLHVVTAVCLLLFLSPPCTALRPLGPFFMPFELVQTVSRGCSPPTFTRNTCPWLVTCSAHYSLGLRLNVTSSEQPSLAPHLKWVPYSPLYGNP